MKPKCFLLWLFICMLLSVISSGFASASPPAQAPTPTPRAPSAIQALPREALAKIEPSVVEELTAVDQANFFIWMTEKADLRPAERFEAKEEKGKFVFETLRRTAEQSQAALRQVLDQQKADYRPFYIANKILVRGGSATLLASAAIRSDVARITADHTFRLVEPTISAQPPAHTLTVEPNLTFVNADDVWAMGYDGSGAVLAGNDTGLDWDHPALIDSYRGWNGVTVEHNYNWWDATGTYPSAPRDGHGHGTHITGIMVGDDGGANRIGMAPGARTIHCKNLTDWGVGTDATVIECFEWDLAPWDLSGANPRPDLAPDAINNSWGYSGGNHPAFEDEIAALQAAGILVEASAGNSGPGCASLGSPGDYRQILTTGSVNHASGNLPGTLTWFSSRGPSSLHPIPPDHLPDVLAPGENIRSSLPHNAYVSWSGTSMAGPHVTGLVGLIWSANPALRGQVETTIQLIQDTAIPLMGQTGSNCGGDYITGPNNDWGHGTIDALAAVQQALLYGGTGTLSGTVTDAVLQTPISGTIVQAAFSPTMTWQTSSDPQGNYVIRVISGTYTVVVSRYGYLPAQIANVPVVSEITTTLDVALMPADSYVVSGHVTDSATGWPLYAAITIDGYPGAPIWSDPLSGFYSVSLPEGTAYVFDVRASHYSPQSRIVGPLTGDQSEDFALHADFGQGCPAGYQESILFADGFESGNLGPTWSVLTTDEGRVQVSTGYPYTGHYGVLLDDVLGNSTPSIAALTLAYDLSGQSQVDLDFWWREFDDENNPEDGVFISDDAGATWHQVLSFNDGPNAFRNNVVDLSAAAAANGLTLNDRFQIRFQFYDNSSIAVDGYAIDEVRLISCTSQPNGRVFGHVYDANTGLPLEGATVGSDGGQRTTTDASGFYQLFETPGTHTVTAALGNYESDVQTLTVVEGNTTQQDLHLPAGWLSYTPSTLEVALDLGARTILPFTLLNAGNATASFALQERDRGPQVAWVAIDQSNEWVYQAESGESAAFCTRDVAWLSKDPVTGTIVALANQVINVTFDASVPEIAQPGRYYARLRIAEDTPYEVADVPITMTVRAPTTWGKLAGTVRSLGHCDASPTPLRHAPLLVEGSTGLAWTLETDASGAYQIWLDESHDPLTITVAYPDHEVGLVANVRIHGQTTTTRDVGLRWLRPCIDVAPITINARVIMGRAATETVTISNKGAMRSDFALIESDGGFASARLPALDLLHATGRAHVAIEDKEGTWTPADRAALPLAADGPDPFGYTYRDSTEPDGPTYRWLEIAPPAGGSGTEIAGLTGVDDGYFWPLSLPFPFRFYGTDYTEMAIASNGTLSFEDTYLGFSNSAIPGLNNYGVNMFVAHLWDDLVIRPGAVYYQALDSMLIVEYYQVSGFHSPDHGTWEVVLFANGNILFQYQDVTFGDLRDDGGSATVGIQGDPATGLQYAYNAAALSEGLAICLAYPGQAPDCSSDVVWLSQDPADGDIAADGTQMITITLDASVPKVAQPGNYHATLLVQTDDPAAPWFQMPVTMAVTRYGAKLAPPAQTRSGDPGATVTYTLQVTNIGIDEDTFDISVSGNAWPVTAPARVGPLAAGASASTDIAVAIPASAGSGAIDAATVVVTSQGDSAQSAAALLTTEVQKPTSYTLFLPLVIK